LSNEQAVLKDPNVVLHSFKHAQTTWLKRNGATDNIIAPVCGHAPKTMAIKNTPQGGGIELSILDYWLYGQTRLITA
jgi:hypothetical protein